MKIEAASEVATLEIDLKYMDEEAEQRIKMEEQRKIMERVQMAKKLDSSQGQVKCDKTGRS